MVRNTMRFSMAMTAVMAAMAAALPPPAHAWAAAGPRGVAAGGYGGGVAYGSRGGSAAWTRGTAAVTGPQGNTAAWHRPPPPVYHGGGYYHGGYYGGGYSSGQVAGAAVAGLAVGAMAGAAVAKSSQPSSTTVVVQESPGASQMPIGTQVTVLPGNCGSATVGGVEYYNCGPNWFKPYFGNSSVYYKVVAAPY